MNCLLPQNLTLTSLPFTVDGQLRMGFTLSLGFALNDTRGRVLAPNEAWEAAIKSLSPDELPDMGLPKPAAEWLMAGSACAPASTESAGLANGYVHGLPVDITVGPLSRQFLVSGDAYDDGVSLPTPTPFQHMPLSWSRTLGGPDHPENPLGCGIVRENGLRRVPNIADRNPLKASSPACPSARGFWPSRMAHLGAFDTPWLLTRWPGVPNDFDWSFYHLAQPCQRFSRYLVGNEALRITNMHPQHAVIEGRLPRLRARLFANYGTEQQPDWREASVNADTVWLFPNALAGLVFWHGTLPTADERGTDMARIVAALESTETPPRSAADCIAAPDPQIAEIITETQLNFKPSVVETPLIESTKIAPPTEPAIPNLPPVPLAMKVSAIPDPPKTPQATLSALVAGAKTEMQQLLPEINAALKQQGLPEVKVEDITAALDKQAEGAVAMLNTPDSDPATVFQEAGLPADFLQKINETTALPVPQPEHFSSVETYNQAAELYAETVCTNLGVPEASKKQLLDSLIPERMNQAKLLADQQIAELENTLGMSNTNELKAALSALPEGAGDAGSLAFLEQAETLLGLEKGATTGHFKAMLGTLRTDMYSPENLPLGDVAKKFPDQAAAFAKLQQLVQQLPQQPPEGLFDLSSLGQSAGLYGNALAALVTLDPMPMSLLPDLPQKLPALPELPELPEITDSGTPLDEISAEIPAELPYDKDSLQAALASGMPLEGQNLAGLDLAGASFVGMASLRGLLLDGSHCDGSDFSGCDLGGARFTGASFVGARLAGTNLSNCTFAGADLSGADLTGACCHGADFTGAKLNNAILAGLACDHADFSGATLTASCWHGAQGEGVFFGACHSTDADFSRVRFPSCSFSNAQLEHALFVEAALPAGTFQNCTLTRADCSRADFRNLRVYDTRFITCCFESANLADCGWLRVTTEALDARNATATGAVFEECAFQKSDWACTSARKARWLLCDLRGSRLDRLDLLDGALRGSHLGDASLAGANLFGADMYRIGTNAGTVLLGADIGNTCLSLAERA